MAEKYVQTTEDLEQHLEEQVLALKRSAEGFDAGADLYSNQRSRVTSRQQDG